MAKISAKPQAANATDGTTIRLIDLAVMTLLRRSERELLNIIQRFRRGAYAENGAI